MAETTPSDVRRNLTALALASAALAAVPAGWLVLHPPFAARATWAVPPAQGDACTLRFVGSSSIARWNALDTTMAPWAVDNRGTPGALLNEVLGQIDGGPTPAAVVLYGGDNDLAAGTPPATVIDALAAVADRTAQTFGETPLFVIALKPSPARWDERDQQSIVNDALRRLAASRRDLIFVDIAPRFVAEGQPRPLFDPDGVHLNAAGYRIWTAALQSALRRRLPRDVVARCGLPGDTP